MSLNFETIDLNFFCFINNFLHCFACPRLFDLQALTLLCFQSCGFNYFETNLCFRLFRDVRSRTVCLTEESCAFLSRYRKYFLAYWKFNFPMRSHIRLSAGVYISFGKHFFAPLPLISNNFFPKVPPRVGVMGHTTLRFFF